MDGALGLASSEEGILSDTDHVNLVSGIARTSHLQALSSTGIGSALMFCASVTAELRLLSLGQA